jgi:hypothetical protein
VKSADAANGGFRALKRLLLLPLVLLLTAAAGARGPQKVPALASVNTVYVQGNNAASEARELLQKGKYCFSLAPTAWTG